MAARAVAKQSARASSGEEQPNAVASPAAGTRAWAHVHAQLAHGRGATGASEHVLGAACARADSAGARPGSRRRARVRPRARRPRARPELGHGDAMAYDERFDGGKGGIGVGAHIGTAGEVSEVGGAPEAAN